MTGRSRLWLGLASVFTLVNAGGAVFAAAEAEALHTAVHVVLLAVGVYAVWLSQRARRQDPPSLQSADAHLEQLEHSVEAIALEVERIGEAQRFMVKLQQERAESQG
jgi:hypothetical protein